MGAVVGCQKGPSADEPAVNLTGLGATFPAPLYQRWITEYARATNTRIAYQALGSGAGIEAIMSGSVDFAGSDAPMTDDQLSQVGDIQHIPSTVGAVTLAYNLSGVDDLRLHREALAGILSGRITRWNDPKIASLNPGASLPDAPIKLVYRADGSGTTKILTDYVSRGDASWKDTIGVGTNVKFPVGLGAKGNQGAAEAISRLSGAFGYVELNFARANSLRVAQLFNRAGRYVEPTLDSTTAAAASAAAKLPGDLRISLLDSEAPDAYPIASFSYLLVAKDGPEVVKRRALAKFLLWVLSDGQRFAPFLHYSPLPDAVVKRAQTSVRALTGNGQGLL
jgi:phosphate transport system substrate-binding protein